MSSQGVSTTAVYMAYNSTTGAYVVGDTANHTIKFVRDGSIATPANSPTEVSGAGVRGAYAIALTSSETQCSTCWIGGNSSTANTIIIPITLTFTSTAQLGVNVVTIGGSTPAALIGGLVQAQVSGTPGVNLTQWLGTAPAPLIATLVQTQVSGSPSVNVTQWQGSPPASLVSALVQTQVSGTPSVVVVTNNDKTGYSLTQAFPGNFSSLAITGGGAVTVGTNNDKTGYSLTGAEETSIANAVWDNASGIETNVTPRQALKYLAAANLGTTTGALTNTFTISAMSASGTTRITATTDSSGNRSAVVLS
jgi:hypothetical protein